MEVVQARVSCDGMQETTEELRILVEAAEELAKQTHVKKAEVARLATDLKATYTHIHDVIAEVDDSYDQLSLQNKALLAQIEELEAHLILSRDSLVKASENLILVKDQRDNAAEQLYQASQQLEVHQTQTVEDEGDLQAASPGFEAMMFQTMVDQCPIKVEVKYGQKLYLPPEANRYYTPEEAMSLAMTLINLAQSAGGDK